MLSEHLGPRLDHGEHGVIIADGVGLRLLNHAVVDINGAGHHILVVDKRSGYENVAAVS